METFKKGDFIKQIIAPSNEIYETGNEVLEIIKTTYYKSTTGLWFRDKDREYDGRRFKKVIIEFKQLKIV